MWLQTGEETLFTPLGATGICTVPCTEEHAEVVQCTDGDNIIRVTTQFIIQTGILQNNEVLYSSVQDIRYKQGLSQTHWEYEHLDSSSQH